MKKIAKNLIVLFVLFFLISCPKVNNDDIGIADITILYTNDEHGWLEGDDNYDGAAGMLGL